MNRSTLGVVCLGALCLGAAALGDVSRAAAVQSSAGLAARSSYAPIHSERVVAEKPPMDADELAAQEDKRERRVQRVLARARRFLGKRVINIDGKRFHWDCANYVRAAFNHEFDIMSYKNGPKTRSGVRRIWYFGKRRGGVHFRRVPLVGDLLFFHQTYDSNGNRRADDYFTHIALVEKVDKDGTVTYVDRAINGIARRKMNLYYPDRAKHPRTGKVINSHVRPRRRWDRKGDGHLSGSLFAGFATVIP